MALTERALLDTREAFDGVAPDYDRSNVGNPILAGMRARSIAALRAHVSEGAHILDLGCGPGTDEATLVAAGYRVTAIDWSPAMVLAAQRRVDAEALAEVDVKQLGIHQLDALGPAMFDAAYSSFGPLNCVPDLADAARQIANRLRPGGTLVASVIGRICPWEIALHAVRADVSRIRVRFARHPVAVPLNGRTVWMSYWTPAEFIRPFVAQGFRQVSLRGLGLVGPPPYLDAWARRHPRMMSGLQRLDAAVGRWPGLRHWGDHFLVVLRRG